MNELINILLEFSQSIGYFGIIFLMTIESSFIPFPSEIVIPPAAYLASIGKMNIFMVIFSGTIGSVIGASINYFLARAIGRKIIYKLIDYKFFKLLLLNKKKIIKAENYFLKYGNISTFLGRFIPAVRQLISIPAGFSKMNFKNFIIYTTIGSGIWVSILALLGYLFGANQEILIKHYKEICIAFILIFALIIIVKKSINSSQNRN